MLHSKFYVTDPAGDSPTFPFQRRIRQELSTQPLFIYTCSFGPYFRYALLLSRLFFVHSLGFFPLLPIRGRHRPNGSYTRYSFPPSSSPSTPCSSNWTYIQWLQMPTPCYSCLSTCLLVTYSPCIFYLRLPSLRRIFWSPSTRLLFGYPALSPYQC